MLQFPSASATGLGSGKWEIGPAAAAILTWGSWVVGGQAYNLWSFAGDSTRPGVNHVLLQPLVTYTLPGDWYLTSSPQVTERKGVPGEYHCRAERITDLSLQEKVMAAFRAKYGFRDVISGVIRLGKSRIFRLSE